MIVFFCRSRLKTNYKIVKKNTKKFNILPSVDYFAANEVVVVNCIVEQQSGKMSVYESAMLARLQDLWISPPRY